MFWISDVTGRVASINQTWRDPAQLPTYTFHDYTDEVSFSDVHRDDIDALRRLLSAQPDKAVAGRFRVLRSNGEGYVWVSFVGTPALSPDDGSFCGYIGSATVVRDMEETRASAANAPPSGRAPNEQKPHTHLDWIMDHLLSARTLATAARDQRIVRVIDLALLMVGDRLACDEA